MITKRDTGKPCNLAATNGRTKPAHGQIASVQHGVVTIIDVLIDGVHTADNGHYTVYTTRTDKGITVL